MTGIKISVFNSNVTTGDTIYKEMNGHLNFNNHNLKQKARLPILIRINRKHFI